MIWTTATLTSKPQYLKLFSDLLQNFNFANKHMSIKINLNVNPLSTNATKWSNTLKKFIGNSRRIECV